MDIGNPNTSQVIINNLGENIKPYALDQTAIDTAQYETNPIYWRKESNNKYYIHNALMLDNHAPCKSVVFPIGTWNMDTTENVSVPHSLGANFINVISIEVLISNDAESLWTPLTMFYGVTGQIQGGINSISSTNFNLYRLTGGVFDQANYSNKPAHRGCVTVVYSLGKLW